MENSPFPRSPFEALYGELFNSFNRFDAMMQQFPLSNSMWWRPSAWLGGPNRPREVLDGQQSQQIQQRQSQYQDSSQGCGNALSPWSGGGWMNWAQPTSGWFGSNSCVPRMDFRDAGDKLVVLADMPGMNKSDVKVEAADGQLTIHAQKSNQQEHTEGNWYMKERCSTSFHRSFQLPPNASQEGIKASYNNGVLEVNIPKTQASATPPSRIINVE